MWFHSFPFAVFLPLVLLATRLLGGRALRVFLLFASYVFYGWGQPWACVLLLGSSVLDYVVALRIDALDPDARAGARRAWLATSLVGNLGLLALFKFVGPFGLAAPAGISFYTFQTMAYSVDVYRRRLPAERDFGTFALYVAYFPQLVAGPIERAPDLLPQLRSDRRGTAEDFVAGTTRVLWGLVKKIVFADWLAVHVNFTHEHVGGATPWDLYLGTLAFAFVVYLDFSGYCDIAIGCARLMGVRLRENFRWPYLARNPVEYWYRWHITFSTWIRDYLYFPLGGSRRGRARTLLNVLVVMLAVGLWHGAGWNFVVWGLVHFLLLALYGTWATWRGRRFDREAPIRPRDAAAILLTFHLMIPARVLFRSGSIEAAGAYLGGMFCPWGWPDSHFRPEDVHRTVFLVLLCAAVHALRGTGAIRRLEAIRSPAAVGLLWGLLVSLMLAAFAPFKEAFIYFQF